MTDEPQETDDGQDSTDGGDVQQVKIKRGVNKVVLVAGILLFAVAGKLMNLGKTLVPVELLIKSADLTDDELEPIRQKIRSSADFLDRVDFDGPVVDSIRQMQERLDGMGKPAGLKEKRHSHDGPRDRGRQCLCRHDECATLSCADTF